MRSASLSWAALLMLLGAGHSRADSPDANYDESQVGTYVLPDPLRLANGKPVRDAATWFARRRPEILELLESQVYGRSPGRPAGLTFETTEARGVALQGQAVRRQIVIHTSAKASAPQAHLLIYLPAGARKPVPLVLLLAFGGNQRRCNDPAIALRDEWVRGAKIAADESTRSRDCDRVARTIARGYGFASVSYTDFEPDIPEGRALGVRALADVAAKPAADSWGALAAWAWGVSRVMDYLETDKEVDASRVALVGHSRLGKAVLWAGARDTRFAAVIAESSGEGGAALTRRNYGQTIKDVNAKFPHWFCGNYQTYSERPASLPIDQHMVLALIAPRPLYLATAQDDRWADPRGEWLSAVAAGPVYRLLGKRDLGTTEMPALGHPIMKDVGFHHRSGKHEVTSYDWDRFLDFADLHLRHR